VARRDDDARSHCLGLNAERRRFNMTSNAKDIIGAVRDALQNPLPEVIAKSFTQSSSATSGLTFYDLEAPAKLLFPVLTPLRNRIPRVVGGKGIQANWRAITGINTTGVLSGVSEGQRSGAISHTTADYLAAFRGLGLEDYVTYEADWAAEGFDDARARAVDSLLRATMIQEEFVDLGGNTSLALTQTPQPTATDVASGGTLLASTSYNIYCVALTLAGYQQVAGWNNGVTGQSLSLASAALSSTQIRTNMDGTSNTINAGVAQPSPVKTVATSSSGGNAHSISAYVTPVTGAVAYAWYWGTSGNELLGAVTTINSVLITATATGTQNITALTASDCSTDSLVYDGLLTQIMKSGSGAYFVDLATGTPGTGTKLTTDGAAGITQIETALLAFWDQYRISPSDMYVSSHVLLDINTLVIANGGAPLIRYNIDPGGQSITAGNVVGFYMNKITGAAVKIQVHPNMPPGMIMFWSDTIPYPLSGVGQLLQKKLRRDYYQIEWPIRTRRYEYGVYFDGVLQNYFPPAFGIIRNIAPGT
jgi:hypothetical protein